MMEIKQHQRSAGFGEQGALTAVARFDQDLLVPEPGHGLVAHFDLEGCLHVHDDPPVNRVEGRAGLFDRRSGRHPSKQVSPVAPAVLPRVEAQGASAPAW